MIHAEYGRVEIKGNEDELIADLVGTIQGFYKTLLKDKSRKEVEEIINSAVASVIANERRMHMIERRLKEIYDSL